MSDREAFEKWAAESDLGDNLVFDTSSGYVGVKEITWQAWQAAHAEYGTTDSKKWRVDDLVQDVNGDIFTIEGFKGDKLLVKDASETLWLTPTNELTWHSRATQEEQ